MKANSSGPSVHQTSYHLACEVLGGVLRSAVDSRHADRGTVSVPCRAVAALYVLLVGHPVDARGRCRSCRRPGAVFGWRRRRCQVHNEVRAWLHQPAEFVLSRLSRELGHTAPATPRSPAALPPPVLPGGCPTAGRPDPDHGAAGVPTPTDLRPRRGPVHSSQPTDADTSAVGQVAS